MSNTQIVSTLEYISGARFQKSSVSHPTPPIPYALLVPFLGFEALHFSHSPTWTPPLIDLSVGPQEVPWPPSACYIVRLEVFVVYMIEKKSYSCVCPILTVRNYGSYDEFHIWLTFTNGLNWIGATQAYVFSKVLRSVCLKILIY